MTDADTTTEPDDDAAEMPPLKIGDWVQTSRHGYTGRILSFHARCPEPTWWINQQQIPVTREQRRQPWLRILCDNQGSVTVPLDTVTRIDDPGRPLRNMFTNEYFPND